jgi:hypothetical protein
MNRRSFLKRASGIVAGAACALYIPAERLEFGVPKAIATASQVGTMWSQETAEALKMAQLLAELSGPQNYLQGDTYGREVRFADLVDRSYEQEILQASGDVYLYENRYMALVDGEAVPRVEYVITDGGPGIPIRPNSILPLYGRIESWPEHIERQLAKKRPASRRA